MNSDTNKHGLRRYIPRPIRQQIRQECGFGCVTCGLAVAQYEHVDPPFADATHHQPSRMAMLCGACHDKVTRGIWSKDKIAQARKNPITFRNGNARDAFDLRPPLVLHLGTTSFENVQSIIRTGSGETWLKVAPPESDDQPFLLSAQFFNEQGHLVLTIEDNDWSCPTTAWDLQVEGKTITVRSGEGDIALRLEAVPPCGLRLQRLKMLHRDFTASVSADGVMTLVQGGTRIDCHACSVADSDSVFTFDNV